LGKEKGRHAQLKRQERAKKGRQEEALRKAAIEFIREVAGK
jgi:hypothetical protein